MQLNNEIIENLFIENLVKQFGRSKDQINKLHESDAELLRLPNCSFILALTTDCICEEIEEKLYDDPYMIGWMTITVNLSDLAAVGAAPAGILLNQTFKNEQSCEFIKLLQLGIADACEFYQTSILGGDSNFSTVMQMSGTAVGIINREKPLMRSGCNVGDIVYASGTLGGGNCFAFSKLSGFYSSINYKPKAKLSEGGLLLDFASCCIDTSDGLFASLDQLMRINNLGFKITNQIENMISKEAKELCDSNKIPYWFMLAGIHGEYELVFTIPGSLEREFINAALLINWEPVKIGEVTGENKIEFIRNREIKEIDTGKIRNLFSDSRKDIHFYLNELMKMEKQF